MHQATTAARVIVSGRRALQQLAPAQQRQLEESSGRLHYRSCELASGESVEQLIETLTSLRVVR